ncbi:hypothetical protein [Lactiplantibacillus daowaiensis]|uniref:Integral membrane protein n=1 Tax=Lactiplantibacillus daowaiensis TaxID=2559918 RepID=A0ABW1S2C8_9LACO|nr:hypothetical protein [Lactiplantibacillus daowaiensis]
MAIQRLLLALIILVLFLYLFANWQIANRQRKYRNDERWQLIRLRANTLTKAYYEGLVILICLVTVGLLFTAGTVLIRLDRALLIAALLIMLGQIVEYLAIRRLDQQL